MGKVIHTQMHNFQCVKEMASRSLIVSNIPLSVPDYELDLMLRNMFSNIRLVAKGLEHDRHNTQLIGHPVNSIRIMRNRETNVCSGYAIVDFISNKHAEAALQILGRNPRLPRFNTPLILSWSYSSCYPLTIDQYQVYLGFQNISVLDEESLMKQFNSRNLFPSQIKISKDKISGKNRQFGFARFNRDEDAVMAVSIMQNIVIDGYPLIVRSIYKNSRLIATYEDSENTCVFVTGLDPLLQNKDIQDAFSSFGKIRCMRFNTIKRFCFLLYEERESALAAITHMTGSYINQNRISCYSGRNYYFNQEIVPDAYEDPEYIKAEEEFINRREIEMLPISMKQQKCKDQQEIVLDICQQAYWLNFYANKPDVSLYQLHHSKC